MSIKTQLHLWTAIAIYFDLSYNCHIKKYWRRCFMFNEICIYEAKLTKLDDIETLMKEVAEFYLKQDGVIDVHYIKRTHRQKDLKAVKEGELPVRLTRNVGKITYVLYWVLKDEETHARVSKLGMEKFYKRWSRCLITMPKIILGENIV